MNKYKLNDLIIVILSYIPLATIFVILYYLVADSFKPLDTSFIFNNDSRYIIILIAALISSLLLCILSSYIEITKVNMNKHKKISIIRHIIMLISLWWFILPINEYIIAYLLDLNTSFNSSNTSYIMLIIINLIIAILLTYNHYQKYLKK